MAGLGGSRVQSGGPTGGFVVIVYSIVERHGVEGLTLCTIMAGAFLVMMGLLRLVAIIKFIPYPLTVGFTSGIAAIIFSQQMRDLLGLPTAALPAEFLGKWEAYFRAMHTADPLTVSLSALSFAILFAWPRLNRRVPGSIVALLVVTAAAAYWRLPVETIGSRFGDLPSGLPRPALPHLPWTKIGGLIGPALTVAMLGAIESLLSATVADGMIEGRHRSNTELIAQGIANLVTPLFGGIPATGAIARTATNVKNGGRTPVAGMIHALTLLLIVLIFSRWARLIPLCVLAAILVVVSYQMSEWHAFRALLRAPRMDVAVLLTTFALTVFVDLTTAVEVGIVMSAVLFMKRMTDVTTIREVTREMSEPPSEETLKSAAEALSRLDVPPGVVVYDAEGAFFFGVAESLRDNLSVGEKPPEVMILRMRHVVALDASGLRALKDLKAACARSGTRLLLAGLHAQPRAAIESSGFLQEFGAENVFRNVADALKTARTAA
jgi:SulP family sulfate permease